MLNALMIVFLAIESKLFVTLVTLEWCFSRVNCQVLLKVGLGPESLATGWTLKRFMFSVRQQVHSVLMFVVETFATFRTHPSELLSMPSFTCYLCALFTIYFSTFCAHELCLLPPNLPFSVFFSCNSIIYKQAMLDF